MNVAYNCCGESEVFMFNYYQPTRIHFGADRTDEIGKIAKNTEQSV